MEVTPAGTMNCLASPVKPNTVSPIKDAELPLLLLLSQPEAKKMVAASSTEKIEQKSCWSVRCITSPFAPYRGQSATHSFTRRLVAVASQHTKGAKTICDVTTYHVSTFSREQRGI
jgi:hypothetical protein